MLSCENVSSSLEIYFLKLTVETQKDSYRCEDEEKFIL